jgi:hypothetical protein
MEDTPHPAIKRASRQTRSDGAATSPSLSPLAATNRNKQRDLDGNTRSTPFDAVHQTGDVTHWVTSRLGSGAVETTREQVGALYISDLHS